MIRVLLPVDGSDNSARAVRRVAGCSQRLAPVEAHLLYVQLDDGTASTALDEPARNDALEAGNRALQSALEVLARAGIACTSESRKGCLDAVRNTTPRDAELRCYREISPSFIRYNVT